MLYTVFKNFLLICSVKIVIYSQQCLVCFIHLLFVFPITVFILYSQCICIILMLAHFWLLLIFESGIFTGGSCGGKNKNYILGHKETILKSGVGASLVAQWLRICLPMQRTRVRALVWEDPTCRRATGPVSHNY